MTNQEKFNESYSDLVDILYNLTGALSDAGNAKDINEEDLKLLSELTTNLKRMGESAILEYSTITPPVKNIKKEVNKNVDK